MVRFRVSTRHSGRLRTVQVCVYDTLKAMRGAAARRTRINEGEKDSYYKTQAVSQSIRRFKVRASGYTRRLPHAGYLRFCRKNISAEHISHEANHMALGIYRDDVQKTIPDLRREEILCHLTGQIAGRVVDGLYRHKVLQRQEKG